MRMTAGKSKGSKAASARVVVTGKRVRGTWMMESLLSPQPRRSRGAGNQMAGENRRVRTLH
jgi:hypothetical protein